MKIHRFNDADRRLQRGGPWVVTVMISAVATLGASCSSSSGPAPAATFLRGTVTGPSGAPVVGATVYLVPASGVSTKQITGAGVLAQATLDFDEPLEDAVANDGAGFTKATTTSTGSYDITTVPNGSYFLYVEPAAGDTEHFPGGSLCRTAASDTALRGSTQDIYLSSSPPSTATYMGMTNCLTCHEDYDSEKMLAHRLGFRVPGVSSPLQDTLLHHDMDAGLEYFLEKATYDLGTPVYMYDYDGGRGFDKFKTSLTDPTGDGGVVRAILWLWKDSATDEYKITIDNVGNAADPNDLSEHIVKLTYGGAVQKQRYMIDWTDWPGEVDRKGLYPLLQFQSQGSESRYDRTRKVFRDYHLDFYWNAGVETGAGTDPDDDLIKIPEIERNISRNCMGCHATNYAQYTDGDTNEVLCTTLEDPNGEYDIDGNGFINDLNTGCESCHGPGSAHVAANGGAGTARYVLSPEYLSPSRANQLCGRCHNRQEGADAIGGDHPLNAAGEFPLPGISRAEFLADYVKPTVHGPKQSKYWADFKHAKSHHQQYPDFVKSSHYRNDSRLVVCSDCHDMHGGTGFPRALVADPNAPDSELCMGCHGEIGGTMAHTLAMVGAAHGPAVARCVDCHMNKTAKTGSGHYGFLLSAPTGEATDVTETYFENDVSSHVFDVPGKSNAGVAGVTPASAMPIPYTQGCSNCHDPADLQHN